MQQIYRRTTIPKCDFNEISFSLGRRYPDCFSSLSAGSFYFIYLINFLFDLLVKSFVTSQKNANID